MRQVSLLFLTKQPAESGRPGVRCTMTAVSLPPDRAAGDLPDPWRDAVQNRLAAGENVVTWITVDLDAQHHFSDGIVVLTERRILARAPGETDWRDWPFQPGM